MTTATQSQTSISRRPAQWQRAAKIQLGLLLNRGMWFFSIATFFMALSIVVVSRFGDPSLSFVQFAYQGTLWFQFAMMVAVFVWYATVHVANGLTRRSLTIGSLMAGLGSALFYAITITALLLIERFVFDQFGWSHLAADGSGEVLADGAWAYFYGAFLMFIASNLSGLLVVATYSRVGGWRGTLFLPLTVSPLLLMPLFVTSGAGQMSFFDRSVFDLGVLGSVIALAIIAIAAWAYFGLLRRIPIKAQTA